MGSTLDYNLSRLVLSNTFKKQDTAHRFKLQYDTIGAIIEPKQYMDCIGSSVDPLRETKIMYARAAIYSLQSIICNACHLLPFLCGINQWQELTPEHYGRGGRGHGRSRHPN